MAKVLKHGYYIALSVLVFFVLGAEATPVTVLLDGSAEGVAQLLRTRSRAARVSHELHRRVFDIQTIPNTLNLSQTWTAIVRNKLKEASAAVEKGEDILIYVGDLHFRNGDFISNQAVTAAVKELIPEGIPVRIFFVHTTDLHDFDVTQQRTGTCAVGYSGNDVDEMARFSSTFWDALRVGESLDGAAGMSLMDAALLAAHDGVTVFSDVQISSFVFSDLVRGFQGPPTETKLFEEIAPFLDSSGSPNPQLLAHDLWASPQLTDAIDTFFVQYQGEADRLRHLLASHGIQPANLNPFFSLAQDLDLTMRSTLQDEIHSDLEAVAKKQVSYKNTTGLMHRYVAVEIFGSMGALGEQLTRMRGYMSLARRLNGTQTFWSKASTTDRLRYQRILDCEVTPIRLSN